MVGASEVNMGIGRAPTAVSSSCSHQHGRPRYRGPGGGPSGDSVYYCTVDDGSRSVQIPGMVRSLDRGLRILTLFDEGQAEWSINAISNALDLPLASTYRIVNTLIAQGFL